MSRVAFLGLGRMGGPMAVNLARAGHELTVWNRTEAKAVDFAREHGAKSASTPREAVTEATFVVTMLSDDEALRQAYHGDDGVLAGLTGGAVAVDMSTVSPQTIIALAAEVTAAGGSLVDAPVSGSVAAATTGSLTIMAAGDKLAVDRARSVLEDMGDPVIYMGDSGRGSIMKLCVNAIVHSLNGAVSESLVLAERSGIEAADRADTEMPQTQLNLDVLNHAVDAGYGDLDESGVAEFLRASGATPTEPAQA